MDNADKPAADSPPQDADLVVIDRNGLKEMLNAVANTLRASQSLMEMGEVAPEQAEQYAQVRRTVGEAHTSLIDGVERISAAIDELPSAVMKEDEAQ